VIPNLSSNGLWYSPAPRSLVKESVDRGGLARKNEHDGRSATRREGDMPIRFRCVYCNQLLGISRRKAGSIVRCTTCQGQLIVPDPAAATEMAESGPKAALPKSVAAGGGAIFERDDFDALLEPLQANGASGAAVRSSAPAASPESRGRPSSKPVPYPSEPPLLMLTRRQMTVASVLLVLSLGLAFACGLWLGLALH
jgi:hypothetical protein